MKKCPYCAEEIQDEAIVCRYCGRDLTNPLITQKKYKKPWLAVVLNLIPIPLGVGYIYLGMWGRFFACFIGIQIVLLTLVSIWFGESWEYRNPFLLIIWLLVLYDAYVQAKNYNTRLDDLSNIMVHKDKHLSPELLTNIEMNFTEIISHIIASETIAGGITKQNRIDMVEVRKIIQKAYQEIVAGRTHLHDLRDIWQEGRSVSSELEQSMSTLEDFLKNLFEWTSLYSREDFDIFKEKDKEKYQSFVLRNRQLGLGIDIHLEKAFVSLKEKTGLDLSLENIQAKGRI